MLAKDLYLLLCQLYNTSQDFKKVNYKYMVPRSLIVEHIELGYSLIKRIVILSGPRHFYKPDSQLLLKRTLRRLLVNVVVRFRAVW